MAAAHGNHGFAFLAAAVSGRTVAVHYCLSEDALGFSDGAAILVPADLAGGWPLIVAQATLIAANSLDIDILRHLLGHGAATRRYVYLEVIRAARSVRDRLPSAYEALPELHNASPLTESAGESLQMAKSARVLPNLSIGDRCTIGAGAVVVRSALDSRTVVGVPGRAKD